MFVCLRAFVLWCDVECVVVRVVRVVSLFVLLCCCYDVVFVWCVCCLIRVGFCLYCCCLRLRCVGLFYCYLCD